MSISSRTFAEEPSAPTRAGSVDPVAAASPGWSPIYTGSYFTRYELRRGYDDLGLSTGRTRFAEGDAVFYRVRFGLNTGLLSLGRDIAVALQITPQAAGTFGNNGPNTIADAQLGLHEGYARIQGKTVRFDAGRYEMVYGDALMIGNNDWNEVGRTFDGVRARIGGEAWLDLFANVIDEGRPDFRGAGDGDLYFLGAYAALGPLLREALELDAYALARVWGVAKDVQPAGYRREGAAETTLGVRSKARFGDLDYRVETGLQTGTRPGAAATDATFVRNVKALAWQADLELGLTVLDERVRIALEGLYATGADPRDRNVNHGWEDLFPSAHKWLGLADAFNQDGMKRTNVGSGVLHVSAAPLPQLSVQLDGHVFARPQPEAIGGRSGFAGGELDVGAVYVIANGLKVRALYGLFVPSGNLYSDNIPDRMARRDADPAHYFEAELRYDLLP
ncbi:MAG TPA: alginate export family protein [Polyangiales bacterium]